MYYLIQYLYDTLGIEMPTMEELSKRYDSGETKEEKINNVADGLTHALEPALKAMCDTIAKQK